MEKTFLLVPGAWMGKWIWSDLTENLERLNHKVLSITLSGLESQNANKEFGLQDHVDDVKNFINNNDLSNITLVGHSYSGFVIGQVADQIPDKISQLIFIEAFLPIDGQNLFQGAGLDQEEENQAIEDNNGSWSPPKLEELKQQSHMTEEQVEYLHKNLIDHPAKSVRDKANIKSDKIKVKSIFIGGNFNLSDRQKSIYGEVDFYELNGGHWPMLTKLNKLTEILTKI